MMNGAGSEVKDNNILVAEFSMLDIGHHDDPIRFALSEVIAIVERPRPPGINLELSVARKLRITISAE